MESSIFKQAADFLRNKKNAKRWLAAFLCLAVVAGIGTYAGLKMNGRAMTKKSRKLVCSYELHKHTDDCYKKVDGKKKLVCGYADYVVHSHNDDCYDEDGKLVCQLPEIKEHKHSDDCYETQRTLTCGKEESKGHKHTDDCYKVNKVLACEKEESEGHTHGDGCYDEEGNLTCEKEESEGHAHSDKCYKEEKELVCGKEESEGHEHSDKCYSKERVLTCDKLELHTHKDKCYEVQKGVDKDGDGKDDKIPVCGIPMLEEHMHTADCFQIVEAGEETSSDSGDTADGDAADGNASGDGGATDSKTADSEAVDGETTDSKAAGNKAVDSKAADGETTDSDEEREVYTMTPEEPEAAAEHTKTYEDDGMRVTAEYGDDAEIPDDAELRVKKVSASDDLAHYEQRKEEALGALGTNTAGNVSIYNIGFFLDKKEIEPAAPVEITIQVLKDGFETGDPIKVVHFGEKGAEVIGDTKVDEDGNASFTSDEFSDFAVIGAPGNDEPTIGDGVSQDDAPSGKGNMKNLLRGVTIKDNKGEEVTDGKLYVGESYTIHLEFREGGAQAGDDEQFHWDEESGTMTFQIPSSFQVDKYENVPLEITVGDQKITVGHYSIDENGLLTLKLTEEGKAALSSSNDIALTFDMTATAQATEGSGDQNVHFGDVGNGFEFTVTDQPRLDVQKSGGYQENEEGNGGTLSYTVTTTVAHGTVENAQVTDVLTPPQTDAIQVGDYQNVKVTLKRAADGPDGEAVELKPDEYDLVPGEPDPDNPEKQTFIVKLKDPYATLYEGDVLNVSYEYDVDYNMSGVGLLSGNVLNEVTVRGSMPLEDPDDPDGKPPVEVEENRNSNVYINVATTGDGVIFKDQHYDEATGKLHYTLYTVIPKGKWSPLYIQDDMYVNYGGERWYIEEFSKDGGRVALDSLTVKAVDLPDGRFGWKDTENPDKLQGDLQTFVEQAKTLKGFDFDSFYTSAGNVNSEYDAKNIDQYVYYLRGRTLNIIFGFDANQNYNDYWGKWGSWDYSKDRLVITEYDLNLLPGTELTVKDLNSTKTRTLTPEQVLRAGITNTVNLRFSGYFPGYATFFNNIEDINKTGAPDKNTNTIDYTVTVGMSDDTVRDYFKSVSEDIYKHAHAEGGGWFYVNDGPKGAVFYDELPDGWEYVPGSLYAMTKDRYGNTKTFAYPSASWSELSEDGRSISAPLYFFRGDIEFFNMFVNPDDLTEVSFHYTLKASRNWLLEHAEDTSAVEIDNYAAIKDSTRTHWDVDNTIRYLPNRLTKTAKQVGETNLIEFTLEMNPAGANLDPNKEYLIVTDESTGIEIQPGSIVVSRVKDDGTVEALEDLGDITLDKELESGQWGRLTEEQKPEEQEPEEQKHQFKLKVPDRVPLRITYQALVIDFGDSVPVTNKASIDGVTRSDSNYEKSLKVNEIYAGGSGSTYELTFEKTDSTDSSKKLSDAQFRFYIVRQGESKLEQTKLIKVGEQEYSCYSGDDWVIITGEDGTFHIGGEGRNWNLEPGNYYILEETKAPAGYETLEEPVLFYFGAENQVDKTNYPDARAVPGGILTVGDPPIPYDLPETGGSGTIIYTMSGLLLIAAFGALMYNKKIRERRRRSSRI